MYLKYFLTCRLIRANVYVSSLAWTAAGEYGATGSKYQQKLVEYPTRQPLPDGISNGDRVLCSLPSTELVY